MRPLAWEAQERLLQWGAEDSLWRVAEIGRILMQIKVWATWEL